MLQSAAAVRRSYSCYWGTQDFLQKVTVSKEEGGGIRFVGLGAAAPPPPPPPAEVVEWSGRRLVTLYDTMCGRAAVVLQQANTLHLSGFFSVGGQQSPSRPSSR